MTYQEKEISKNHLEKAIQVLDLDEGIRIENKNNMIFINKSGKRFCINTSMRGKEGFSYCDKAQDVLEFLKEEIDEDCRIFSY